MPDATPTFGAVSRGAKPGATLGAQAWRRFHANRPALWSLWLLVGLLLVTWLGPWAGGLDPNHTTALQFSPPTTRHWFGTDVHGRDLFTRLCAGARLSLLVGIVGALVSLFIGVCWGSVAGYIGGRLDDWMMRFVDILYSLPGIVFVIVMITSLEQLAAGWLQQLAPSLAPSLRLLFLFVGLGAVSWLTMARIVRGQVLTLRTRAFVLASQSLGASHCRILIRHILPNITGIVIVYLTLSIPSVILYESFLSYLGLGIRPPQASLGTLIAEGASQINPIHTYWWLLAFPASFLGLALLALSLIGDGLRDALDPKAG